MLKVCKFGGSSLSEATQYQKVKSIVERDPARRVIVVSAPGKRFEEDHKITDLLYLTHAHLKYGVSADAVFSPVKERFFGIRDTLGLGTDLESEFAALESSFSKTMPEADLVSRGEYLTARLLADYLGFRFADAAELMKFSPNGSLDRKATYEAFSKMPLDTPVVIPGFYGSMPDHTLRLMPRGGSDITGSLAAAALEADVYENWTDVSGILMADPRIVKDARPIPKITYAEMRELSFIGAEVLHEESILPVREKNIPLNIRNTNDPDHPGTLIHGSFEAEPGDLFLTGIAGKKGYTIITITKDGMSSAVGAVHQILGIFRNYNIPISYMSNGINCYSCIIEESVLGSYRYPILADIEQLMNPDEVFVSEHIAMLAIVGRNMAFRSGSCGKIFKTLGDEGINVRVITQGPEEVNIIIGVEERDFEHAVRSLYRKFV